jgi:hypothetical protein
MLGIDARQLHLQIRLALPRRVFPRRRIETQFKGRPTEPPLGRLPGHGLLAHVCASRGLALHAIEWERVNHETFLAHGVNFLSA